MTELYRGSELWEDQTHLMEFNFELGKVRVVEQVGRRYIANPWQKMKGETLEKFRDFFKSFLYTKVRNPPNIKESK